MNYTGTAEPLVTTARYAIDLGYRIQEEAAQPAHRSTDDIRRAFRTSGIGRMTLPPTLGGHNTRTWTLFEAIERLSAADGETGWRAAVSAGTNLLAGYIGRAAAGEVFADPGALNTSAFAVGGRVTRESGRWILRGRWPVVGGTLHARWVALGVLIDDGHDTPEHRVLLVPADQLTLPRAQTGAGRHAVGCDEVRADHLEVDIDRSCTLDHLTWSDAPLWRLPMSVALAPLLTAVTFGIAQRALEELNHHQQTRSDAATTSGVVPANGAHLGRAEKSMRAARLELKSVIGEAWRAATRGQPLSSVLQTRVLLTSDLATDLAADVVETAFHLAGAAAVRHQHPLSRAMKEVWAVCRARPFGHSDATPTRGFPDLEEPSARFLVS